MAIAGLRLRQGSGIPADAWFYTLALATLALDQGSKYLVSARLAPGESIPAQGLARITYVFNTGSAFGFFPGQTLFLTFASLIGVVVLLLFYRSHILREWPLRLSIALMLGGALGNLVDRVRLGYVVDFIDVGWWPVFNLADSSIVIGIMLLAFVFLTGQGTGPRGRLSPPLPPRDGLPPSEVGC